MTVQIVLIPVLNGGMILLGDTQCILASCCSSLHLLNGLSSCVFNVMYYLSVQRKEIGNFRFPHAVQLKTISYISYQDV